MSSPKITLRWMAPGDEERAARMAHALWPELSLEEHLAEIRHMLENTLKRRGVLASTPEHEDAGFADISIRDYVNGCTDTPVPMLEGIWVNPDCRRQGVANAMVAHICNWLAGEGYRELCSDTDLENLEAQQAHEAWGFEEQERVVIYRKSLKKTGR